MTTTEMAKLVALDPTVAPQEMVQTMAPVLDGLGGQSIGFLWNNKPDGELLFERLEKLLRERYEIADGIHRRKPTASLPATDEAIDKLMESVQAVIVGLAILVAKLYNTPEVVDRIEGWGGPGSMP